MVEIYFNKELSDITFEVDALKEWKQIAENLGLENQLKLCEGVASPVHYPFMNEVMKRVYETLCPRKVDYKEYKVTTIPLEVLKQISFSVNEGNFQKIEIWYDDKSPDPLVVGIIEDYYCYHLVNGKDVQLTEPGSNKTKYFKSQKEAENYCIANDFVFRSAYQTNTNYYIIARWGDELREFTELKKLAIERFLEDKAGELNRQLGKLNEKIKLIKENTISYFNGNVSLWEVTGNGSVF